MRWALKLGFEGTERIWASDDLWENAPGAGYSRTLYQCFFFFHFPCVFHDRKIGNRVLQDLWEPWFPWSDVMKIHVQYKFCSSDSVNCIYCTVYSVYLKSEDTLDNGEITKKSPPQKRKSKQCELSSSRQYVSSPKWSPTVKQLAGCQWSQCYCNIQEASHEWLLAQQQREVWLQQQNTQTHTHT